MENQNNFNISSLFINICKEFPNKIAIIEEKKSITFKELENEVYKTITFFREKGIKKGDRVLVFVSMGIDLYRIVLAIFYMGAIAVFVDQWVNLKRLSMCCKIANCKVFIAPLPIRIIGLLIPEIRKIPIYIDYKSKSNYYTNIIPENIYLNDSCLITFTTGSTGIPKAVDRSHHFLKLQFDALSPLIKGEVVLTTMPIVLLINLGLGKTSFIPKFNNRKPNNFNADKKINEISKHKVDNLILAPFYLMKLTEDIKENKSIKHITTGGAPIFLEEIEKVYNKFQEVDFKVVYGSTEAEPISICEAKDMLNFKNDIGLYTGKPINTITLKIISNSNLSIKNEKDLEKVILPTGEIGEIIVTGEAVNKTYINNPTAISENKIIIENVTWHRTGDSGYINKNGELFLTGRVANIIYHNNKVFYPFVIESQLKCIKGINEGTLIKIDNRLILVLSTNSSFDINSLCTINYDEIRFIKSFPKDPRHFSKIDYQKLLKMN